MHVMYLSKLNNIFYFNILVLYQLINDELLIIFLTVIYNNIVLNNICYKYLHLSIN